jgi:hypothetical protein
MHVRRVWSSFRSVQRKRNQGVEDTRTTTFTFRLQDRLRDPETPILAGRTHYVSPRVAIGRLVQKCSHGWVWWGMPVIPAPWEAEVERL